METTTRRPWVILSFLCIPVFVGALDLTIVSAILPEILVSLRLPLDTYLNDAAWMITGYLLAYTISMTFTGRLSDLIGRRRVYIACLVIFLFGSYFVAIAHTYPTDLFLRGFRFFFPDDRPPAEEVRTLYMIIVGRIIQAFGAGAMAPVTMAMVADLFPPDNRARPIGMIGAIDTVGWVLGHLYGGVMVNFFGENSEAFADLGLGSPDWRTLFLINILLGIITFGAIWYSFRGIKEVRRRERFDIIGTLLITATLIALTLGLGAENPDATSIEAVQEGGTGTIIYPLLIASIFGFFLFALVESRLRHPLLNLNLFRQPNVSPAGIANVCVGFSLTIGLVAVPLLVNFRAADTSSSGIQDAALRAGLLLSGLTIPMALAAILGGQVSDLRGYRFATWTGLGLAVLGFALCAFTWEVDTSYRIMVIEMALVGTGLGMTISPIGAAVINAASESERGTASALVLALRLIGMTLALSSLTNFAINRVNQQVAKESIGVLDTSALYLEKIVDVVNELFMLGAVICIIGMIVAFWMRGGSTRELQQNQ